MRLEENCWGKYVCWGIRCGYVEGKFEDYWEKLGIE
jgi:hypothetical protein